MPHSPTIDQILQDLDHNHQVKTQTDALARQLIQQLNITYCGELYFYLGQHNACDNHTAVKRWVKQTFGDIDSGDFETNYQTLEQQILSLISEFA